MDEPVLTLESRIESRDVEANTLAEKRTLTSFLLEELDTTRVSAPLSAYCFMTGFIDTVCFTAIYVWVGFQTGNTVQLSLAVARLLGGTHNYTFQTADRQALCSLLSFICGATLGRIGDRIGYKTRGWMALGTFFQALFTMIATISIWKSHEGSTADSRGKPAWLNVLSFVAIAGVSASMGLQGNMAKRLYTEFSTTVVLTTTWCELMTEPKLFHLRRLDSPRDQKLLSVLFVFLGGFTGRIVLDRVGDAGTLGIGTGIRFLVAIWWLFAPAKKFAKDSKQ
ncbi:hypothetical protein JVU11DRAFT_7766 [Chiua virens]|nr:hypothetical protein JVU11DRAFT_7766 [Chiua virens]